MNALKNLSLILLLSLAFTGCHDKSSKLDDFNQSLYTPESRQRNHMAVHRSQR